MSDPQRLLFDKDATASEKELLESWKREQPSAAAREKTLAMLGLGGASIGAAAAGSSIAPKAIASWTMLAATKWVVTGTLLVGLTVAGVLSVRTSAHTADAPSAPLAPPLATALAPAQTPTQTSTSAVVEPWVPVPRAILAPVIPAPVTPAPAVVRSAPHADARSVEASTLAQEIALLDRARSALAAGNAARALELVNDYEARFPEGSFVEEAEVLRVEAMLRAGDNAGATRVGTRFLSAHPASAHAARVRTLLGSAPP